MKQFISSIQTLFQKFQLQIITFSAFVNSNDVITDFEKNRNIQFHC